MASAFGVRLRRGGARRAFIASCGVIALTIALAFVTFVPCARAEEPQQHLRVGKAIGGVFDFVPLDIGLAKGFFRAHGIAVEPTDFGGSAKLQQALGADALDIGLGSGPELAFVAKGNSDLAVAVFMGPPDSQVLVVRADAPLKGAADLKDKIVGVSTVASLTDWLVKEMARQQGWGPEGVKTVGLGETPARVAALRTQSVDGAVMDIATAADLEQQKVTRTIVDLGKVAPDFITHATFASNKLIAERPDAIRRFLAGWFETIAWMKAHKDETVTLAAAAMHQAPPIIAATYDQLMPTFSLDGKFEPKAMAVLARSFVEMKMLPQEPEMGKLYTEAFLPK
jgi:ABC-type nitrate/sulfonate/bicarbonate transport system substrate-binding protein